MRKERKGGKWREREGDNEKEDRRWGRSLPRTMGPEEGAGGDTFSASAPGALLTILACCESMTGAQGIELASRRSRRPGWSPKRSFTV